MDPFFVLIVFVCYLRVPHSFAQDIVVANFEHSSICNITERVRLNCSKEMPDSRSLLDCSAQCLQFESCNGVSLDSSGNCFLHKDCPYWFECSVPDESHKFLARHCRAGTWNSTTGSCDCPPVGYSGSRCEMYPPACSPRMTEYERIFVDPEQNGDNPIPVTCNSGHVVVASNKGRGGFNRTWEEYKRGFYIDDDHQWLGLDAWYRLSNAGCNKLRSRLDLNRSDIINTRVVYRDIHLLDEEIDYIFLFESSSDTVNNMPGNYQLADCFWDHQEVLFSTWDRDNDGDPGNNCAARAGAGWWFTYGCTRKCNPFGLGPQHWDGKTQEERLFFDGADLGSWFTEDSYYDMNLQSCLG